MGGLLLVTKPGPRTFIFAVLAVNVALISGHNVTYVNEEHKLRAELFENYDTDMPPQKSQSDRINVNFQLSVTNVIYLDEINHRLVVDGWMSMTWADFRLQWKEPKDVHVLRVSPEKIWRPDIYLYNTADGDYHFSGNTPAMIFSTGLVMWVPPKRFTASCPMDIRKFPFDRQVCQLKFGSWTYDGYTLKILPKVRDENHTVDNSSLQMSLGEWQLTRTNGTKNTKYYPCCKEPYDDITYTFIFDRKSTYFQHVFVAPAACLSLLIPFMFTMPPDAGDKTNLGIGIMISLVLLIIAMENLYPSSVSGMPILTEYYAGCFVLAALSMVCNVITLNLVRSRSNIPPTRFLSWVLLDCFGRMVCVRQENYRADQSNAEMLSGSVYLGEQDRETVQDRPTVMEKGPRSARTEWLMMGVVLDRLLFLLFLFLIIIVSIVMLS